MDQLGGRLLHRAIVLLQSPSSSPFSVSRSPSAYFLLSLSFSLSVFPFVDHLLPSRNHRAHSSYRGPNRPFLRCTRRAARDVAWDFFLSHLDVSTRGGGSGGEDRGRKKRKRRRERSVGLLGAFVKSGKINSLRERRQS